MTVLSLIFMVQENTYHKGRFLKTVTNAGYNGLLRFWGGTPILSSDGEEGGTWGGRFTLLAICAHLLLTINSYTANLTNFLVRMGLQSSIASMEEAIAQNKKVCVLRNKIAVLDMAYGKNKIRYSKSPVDGEIGFMKRTELLDALDNNLCSCTVASMEELSTYHGEGLHCDKYRVGDPVIELPWGIPISDRYEAPLTTAISRLMQNGKWRELVDEEKPESMCNKGVSFGVNQQLTPYNMLGSYVVSLILVLLGVFFTILGKINKRCKPRPATTNLDIDAHMAKLREAMASLEEAVTPHIGKRTSVETCSLDWNKCENQKTFEDEKEQRSI